MKIIGLTGSIASGKNFIADIFAKSGCVVFDADSEVHKLLALDNSTILAVKKKFPESFIDGKIERKILGKIVFADKKKLEILEKIIHPKVRKNYQKFLSAAKKAKKEIAVLNIPLLLENKGYKCDYIVAIIVGKKIQKERFIAREKIRNPAAKNTELSRKFEQIRKQQINNVKRKKAADFVINNDKTKSDVVRQVKKIMQLI